MLTFIKNFRRRVQPYVTLENGVLAVAVLIAASLLWSTVQALENNFRLQQQVAQAEQLNELYELESQSLEFQRTYLGSDEFLELQAREKLGKVAAGEKVIVLPTTPPGVHPVSPSVSPDPQQEKTNFEQWLDFFFRKKQN